MNARIGAGAAAPPERGRLIGVLLAAVVCAGTGQSIAMAIGSIVAADLTGTNTWAGLPVAVGALGTALASLPLARLMGRFGRRPGLVLGYALAILGTGLAMAGALNVVSASLLFGPLAAAWLRRADLAARPPDPAGTRQPAA